MTIVVCEQCGATQEIGTTAGFVCARCGETSWYVRCPGCGEPMQWHVGGPKRQRHDACGRTVRLARSVRAPEVERGVIVEPVMPWWEQPGAGLPFELGEADYLGGHSNARPRMRDAMVVMQRDQIRVSAGIRVFVVPWSEVRAVYADSRERVGDRPVVARMAAARAIDLNRDPAPSYLVVETDGEAFVFGCPMARSELADRCRGLLASDEPPVPLPSPTATVSPGPATDDTARVLRELAALHAEGVLSDEEFAAKKAEILRRM